LKGARVIILPDNDEPGRAHGRQVAASLAGIASEVKVVELPGLKAKGDVSDWIAAGGTRAELDMLVSAATPVLQPSLIRSDTGVVKACDYNAKTLMGAAPQFDGLHFDDFLYRARIGARDWSDHDDRDTLCWLQSAHQVPGFNPGPARTAVMALAFARRRDSLFEYVMGLPKWDGTPRIEMAFIDAW